MLLDSFTGNTNIKESLLGALASGRLSHGILLIGQKGQGVNCFGRLLACDITKSTSPEDVLQGKNPLVQVISGEGASGQIKVDSVRRINENVNFSSISGEKRVIIIENCENFNVGSANALLKSLEEPKDDITYILTTNFLSSILPTIRSRCAVFYLSEPTEAETLQYFAKNGTDPSAVKALMKIYGCNIGKIKQAAENDKRYEILQSAIKAYKLILARDAYAMAVQCFEFNKKKDDFKLFISDLEYLAQNKIDRQSVNLLKILQKYNQILSTNANLNLVLENFAMESTK